MKFFNLICIALLTSCLFTNCKESDDTILTDDEMMVVEKVKGCTNPSSDNYDPLAEEDDGSCIPWRDKFIGTYAVEQQCTGAPKSNREIEMATGNAENEILLTLVGHIYNGNITSSSTFELPAQDIVVSGNTLTIAGSGTLSAVGDTIDIIYTVKQGSFTSDCYAVGPKK